MPIAQVRQSRAAEVGALRATQGDPKNYDSNAFWRIGRPPPPIPRQGRRGPRVFRARSILPGHREPDPVRDYGPIIARRATRAQY